MNEFDPADKDYLLVHPGILDYPASASGKPYLVATRCRNCKRIFFPQKPFCRHCQEEGSVDQIAFGSRGIVYTSTVVHVDSPAGIKAPYAIGYVDLEEDHYRIFALFTETDLSLLKPGREVELVIGPLGVSKEEKPVLGYKYRPLRTETNR